MGLLDGDEQIENVGAHHRLMRERLLAEFTGTFFLVLTVGVAAVARQNGDTVHAPAAIGLILGIQIYTFGTVSGGMFNPAVTLAVLLSGRGKIKGMDAAMYVATQFLGGMMGGFFAFGCTSTTFCFDYHRNLQGDGGRSFILEMFYTWALCQTVLHTATSGCAPNNYFGFAIGGTVLASATSCGQFDQGSFNPAVTWGINIAHLSNVDRTGGDPDAASWFIFLFAPLFGSLMAVLVFRGTRGNEYTDRKGENRVSRQGKRASSSGRKEFKEELKADLSFDPETISMATKGIVLHDVGDEVLFKGSTRADVNDASVVSEERAGNVGGDDSNPFDSDTNAAGAERTRAEKAADDPVSPSSKAAHKRLSIQLKPEDLDAAGPELDGGEVNRIQPDAGQEERSVV